MKPERWRQIEELYHAALRRDMGERASFLANSCGEDEALRREVESLLRTAEAADRFLETPAIDVEAQAWALEAGRLQGRRLGPYDLVALLGAGGMGEVYRATDTRLHREVAVKVLPAALTDNPEARTRFEREARAVAAISHPNILAIHDFGTDHGVHFAVMELLEGETLRDRLRSAIPWRKAVEIAAALADGLSAAHAKGITHRDLKPENIFLTAGGLVKILDFGIALMRVPPASSQGSSGAKQVETTAGRMIGTVGYMSPEQLRAEKVDAPSDIFSLGCVLHEMVTGRAPFVRATAAETIAAILTDEPPAAPQAPLELNRIIRHCLEKRGDERYQSARDLAFALKTLSTGDDFTRSSAKRHETDELTEAADSAAGSSNAGTAGSMFAASAVGKRRGRFLRGSLVIGLLLALSLISIVWLRSPRESTSVYTPVEGLTPGSGQLGLTSVLATGGPPVQSPRWSVYEPTPDPSGESKRVAFGTDATERFTLPAGRYNVTVETGSARVTRELEVRAGMLNATELTLNAGVVDLSAVLAPGGPRVETSRWSVHDAATADPLGNPKRLAFGTDPTERFTLPAGRYRVTVESGSAAATQDLEVRAGMLHATELALNAGVVDLTAVLAPGGPRVESLRWSVYETATNPLANTKRLAYGTDPRQRFTLPAGRYRVVAETGSATATQETEIQAGMLNTTELVLNAGVIELTAVLASGGRRVESPKWSVHEATLDALGNSKRIAFGTEPKQRFTLPAGRYRVTVESGGASGTQEITVQPGKLSEAQLALAAAAGRGSRR